MKVRSLVCASVVSIGAFASGPAIASVYDNAVLALSPVAYFNMANANSATTSSTNGYTLSLENGASVVAGTGPTINGSAVPSLVLANGTGGTEYAGEGGSNPLTGQVDTAASIVGWINLAALPSQDGRTFSIAGESTYGDDLDFQIDGDNTMRFYTSGGGGTAAPRAFTTADLNQWVFVAGTFSSNGTRSVYIDGGAPNTDMVGNHNPSNAPFYIGQSNIFGDRYFDGDIADVALYNTQLTTAQIDGLYAAASLPPTVSAVPEPASWAMMIMGFGMIGAGVRYRRRKPTFRYM